MIRGNTTDATPKGKPENLNIHPYLHGGLLDARTHLKLKSPTLSQKPRQGWGTRFLLTTNH